jgi:hypothetical protein
VAKLAHCSRALASRLLRRGFSPAEIVERCERRRAVEAAKDGQFTVGANGTYGKTKVPGVTVPVPSEPITSSHAASFAYHQARKEAALADYREIQVLKARGELLPIMPLKAITFEIIRFQHRNLRLWPSELACELANQTQERCAEILERRVEHLIESTGAYSMQEIARYGIILPDEVANEEPPEPPEPQAA